MGPQLLNLPDTKALKSYLVVTPLGAKKSLVKQFGTGSCLSLELNADQKIDRQVLGLLQVSV